MSRSIKSSSHQQSIFSKLVTRKQIIRNWSCCSELAIREKLWLFIFSYHICVALYSRKNGKSDNITGDTCKFIVLLLWHLKGPVLYLCAGEVSVHLWDSIRIHYSLCCHYNVLCAHPETPEADQVPKKGPQWETHLGHSGDIWHFLATIPCYQYVTGM